MNIKLIPVDKSGSKFIFSSLPEKIKGKSAAKYQSFDILSLGTVKVPKGTDVEEISWDCEFFGKAKRNESIVKTNYWKEPIECVNILNEFMKNETVLNLIVTDTWINLDVTISSFTPVAYGAYGNIQYSIVFVEKKPLVIYDTNELKISAFVKKTKPRNETAASSSGSAYTIVGGDTLSGIALKKCGSAGKWTSIYDTNANTIEAAAKSHGKSSSDRGNWIWPGTTLTIPG